MDLEENIRLRAHMERRRKEVASQYREIDAMYRCNTIFNQKKEELNIKSSSFNTPLGQYTKYLEGVIIEMVTEQAEALENQEVLSEVLIEKPEVKAGGAPIDLSEFGDDYYDADNLL